MCLNDPSGISGATKNTMFRVFMVGFGLIEYPVVFLVATKEIEAGKQLFVDYGLSRGQLKSKFASESDVGAITEALNVPGASALAQLLRETLHGGEANPVDVEDSSVTGGMEREQGTGVQAQQQHLSCAHWVSCAKQ